MPNHSKRIITHVAIIVIAFAAGTCAGILLYPEFFAADQHAHAEDDHPAHEDDHLDLTEQAVANLNLQLGQVELGEYWEQDAFPGEVVEITGQSDLSVAAPVSGVIEEVAIRDGQSVELGDQLFVIRITDSALTSAQSALLGVLSQLDVANKEITRLESVAEFVNKNRHRDLRYEIEKLEAQKLTKIQEILAHGLPQSTLEHVLNSKQLAKRIPIAVPSYLSPRGRPTNELTKQVGLTGKPSFSVGAIKTHPGQAVKTGDHLCGLSYHGELYIKGQAFESDVATITKLSQEDWRVTAEFGHEHHDGHQHTTERSDLKITRIDNHVNREGLFSFYIPIENEVVQASTTDDRRYHQWLFRPGQRVHLQLPVAKYEGQIKLPADAVAISGPNAVVFRVHSDHDHDHSEDVSAMVGIGAGISGVGIGDVGGLADGDGHDDDVGHADDHAGHDHDAHAGHDHDAHADQEDSHAGHDHDAHAGHDHGAHAFLQLEPVPVHVLYRGHDFIVIETNDELHVGDEVAMNAAYKLQLAMQMAAGGGGGHGHEH